jgi:hypothetical protein
MRIFILEIVLLIGLFLIPDFPISETNLGTLSGEAFIENKSITKTPTKSIAPEQFIEQHSEKAKFENSRLSETRIQLSENSPAKPPRQTTSQVSEFEIGIDPKNPKQQSSVKNQYVDDDQEQQETLASKTYLAIPSIEAQSAFDNSGVHQSSVNHPMKMGNGMSTFNTKRNMNFELGVFAKPTWFHNISTIESWVYNTSFGISASLIFNNFIVESGLSYSNIEFEDDIEINYYNFKLVDLLISSEQWVIEEYVNDAGDTLTRRKYIVEVFEIYDSTFVETKTNDRVSMSSVNIPITVGFRITDQGRFYSDIKTGFDLMIVTRKIVPGDVPDSEDIRMYEIFNSLPEKKSVKWKYHLSVGAGYRATEHMSIFAEPTLWWYPDGVRIKDHTQAQKPLELGLRLGLKWAF